MHRHTQAIFTYTRNWYSFLAQLQEMLIKDELPFLNLFFFITSQWLKTSCGLARPLVRFLISSAKPKLSATGRTALIMNMPVPSFISSCSTRPSLLDRTPYTRPGKGMRTGHTNLSDMRPIPAFKNNEYAALRSFFYV